MPMSGLARTLGLGYLGLCALILASLLLGGPRFYAPVALIPAPVAEPIVITLAASSEKETWLKTAVERFAQSAPSVGGRPVQVQLQSMSSAQLSGGLLDGSLKPSAISPASGVEL